MCEDEGVAPSLSWGLLRAVLAPWPQSGRPCGAGARGSLAGEGTQGRGVRRAFPSLLLRSISGGARPGWRVSGEERRPRPARRPSSATEGTAAPPHRGAEGRGEVGLVASPSLGGVTGSRGVRRAGERPSAGGRGRAVGLAPGLVERGQGLGGRGMNGGCLWASRTRLDSVSPLKFA